MFRNWGFLLGEVWLLLALAALLGLIAGWIIWGRRFAVNDAVRAEMEGLRASLDTCQRARGELEGHIARAEADAREAPPRAPEPPAAAEPVAPIAFASTRAAAPRKPEGLTGPRNGQPDDLKVIVGIGPALEKLCHSLGYYHFDQIAAWGPDEVAWVDENLEGFKGRVTRDEWVKQAKALS